MRRGGCGWTGLVLKNRTCLFPRRNDGHFDRRGQMLDESQVKLAIRMLRRRLRRRSADSSRRHSSLRSRRRWPSSKPGGCLAATNRGVPAPVATRTKRNQVVQGVGVSTLRERRHVMNLEPLGRGTAGATVTVAGQGSRSHRSPLRRRVGASVWLGAKARARPAFLAAPTRPWAVPEPTALRAEEGKAHLCRPRSADSEVLLGVAILGNTLAVASARPEIRERRSLRADRRGSCALVAGGVETRLPETLVPWAREA